MCVGAQIAGCRTCGGRVRLDVVRPRKLPDHPNLKVIQADIRDIDTFTSALKGVNSVIHMACISNDPSFELDPNLSKSINYDCFEPMVIAAKAAGVRRECLQLRE